MRRAVVFTAALLLVTPAYVVARALPARACSCANHSDDSAFANADVVFTGDLLRHVAPGEFDPNASLQWVMRVQDVYKGSVKREQTIVTASQSASCGIGFAVDRRYLVFASRDAGIVRPVGGEVVYANLCGGTREASAAPVPAGFGVPRQPARGAALASADGADVPWVFVSAAGLAGLLVLCGLGVAFTARRREPHQDE